MTYWLEFESNLGVGVSKIFNGILKSLIVYPMPNLTGIAGTGSEGGCQTSDPEILFTQSFLQMMPFPVLGAELWAQPGS